METSENMLDKFNEAAKKAKQIPGEAIEVEQGEDLFIVYVGKKSEKTDKTKRKLKARELVRRAQEQAIQHINEGWTEEEFKRQFVQTQQQISEFLKNKEDAGK